MDFLQSLSAILSMPMNNPETFGLLVVASLVFGCCLGSFLNVCIWRIPLGESIVVVASHCPKCNHPIRWFDNVPVIAWLALRGRCRDCGAPISPRYILVELFTGLLFTALVVNAAWCGLPLATAILYVIVLSVVIPCAFIDVEFRKLPDKLTYFGMIAGVLYHWIFSDNAPQALLHALICMVAGLVGLALFAWITQGIFRRKTIGAGDVKYTGFLGAALGGGTLLILCLGSFLGVIGYALMRLFCRRQKPDDTVPFGLYLGIAAVVWCFLAPHVAAYFKFLRF